MPHHLAIAIFAGVFVAFSSAGIFGRTQTVAVNGTLKCGYNPLSDALLDLWDKDRLDPDDQMARQITAHNGDFEITGSETEFTTIDPELRIYHLCGVKEDAKCYRKIVIPIPDEFVNDGEIATKIYNIGTITLDTHESTEGICGY